LVPIRYLVAIEHGEQLFYLKGRISWLLHIVNVSVSHIEGILHIKARLFGYVVYDNLKPRKKKPKATKGSKEPSNKAVHKKAVKNKAFTKKVAEKKAAERKIEPLQSDTSVLVNDTVDQSPRIVEDRKEHPVIKTDSVQEKVIKKEQESVISKEMPIMLSEEHPKSFFKKLWERMKGYKERIASIIQEWKAKLIRIFTTISSFRFKLDLILGFLRDEINKEGMHLTFASLKKLLKHILPTRLKSKIIFGTGDPCSTGQALGAMSILYSFYGDKISITPDFEHSIFEGKHLAKGRIRLVTILIIVVKLIYDKRFKQLKNNFIILKEAL
jgi:hypothetical protein